MKWSEKYGVLKKIVIVLKLTFFEVKLPSQYHICSFVMECLPWILHNIYIQYTQRSTHAVFILDSA